jgi:hypothetical protein
MQTRSSSNGSNKGAPGADPPNETVPTTQHGRKATNSKSKKTTEPKCQWSPEEEKRLIVFLVSRKSEAGDGGSFKAPTWTAAVQEMAKFPTKGPNKNATACSSKYGRVSISKHHNSKSLTILQLRTQYNLITTLKGLSGLGSRYTTELGMNIGVAEESVWKEYVTVSFFR